MKRCIAAIVCVMFLAFPASTLADTYSATATVSVTIPPMPLAAVVQPGCEFVIGASIDKAYCTVTLIVADPTLRNTGWKITLAATDLTCTCNGLLPSNALTIDSSDEVVLINGQEIDRHGGPRLLANSIGRSTNSSQPLLVAKPDFGNGAYSVTLRLRLSVPAHSTPGTYVPVWSVKLSDTYP